jgi:hypothetical protein
MPSQDTRYSNWHYDILTGRKAMAEDALNVLREAGRL